MANSSTIELAQRFVRALNQKDEATIRQIYAPDARICLTMPALHCQSPIRAIRRLAPDLPLPANRTSSSYFEPPGRKRP